MRAEFRDNLTNAIRYWELKRVIYNLVLAAIVIVQFCLQWPASKAVLQFDPILGLTILALLANIAYCAAYIYGRPILRSQRDMAAISLGSVFNWDSFRCHADILIFPRLVSLGLPGSEAVKTTCVAPFLPATAN